MILIISGLFLSGCKDKTEIKYIVPTGHSVAEVSSSGTEPVNVKITDSDSDSDTGSSSNSGTTSTSSSSNSGTSNSGSSSTDDGYQIDDKTYSYIDGTYETVVGSVYDTEVSEAKDASLDELRPKICSTNEVILGYVGCYYDESKTSATITLKNSGRADIDEMWFYIKLVDRQEYAKADGFDSGHVKDFKMPLLEWTQEYGNIQRILVTPVIKDGTNKDACNNRQLLLIPEQNCREMVGE
ncbi:hypothetical protein ACFL6I_11210 [candidate division KSB1 bacterium]